MPGHIGLLLSVVLAATLTVAAALATRVQVLPDVIDLTVILTGAGLGGLVGASVAAVRGFDSDGIARAAGTGSLTGGGVMALIFAGVLLVEVIA